jgi:hypothetical protein
MQFFLHNLGFFSIPEKKLPCKILREARMLLERYLPHIKELQLLKHLFDD